MKTCPKCNFENKDSSLLCENCGERLNSVSKAPTDPSATAGDFIHKAGGLLNAGAKKAQQATMDGIAKAKELQHDAIAQRAEFAKQNDKFVDADEVTIATIGSNYLQNYLSGGYVSKGIGILTQKRFYFKGKNFTGSGKNVVASTQEGIVSIDDITYTMFEHTRHIGVLIFAIILTLIAVLLKLSGVSPSIPLIAAIPLYITYFIKRQTLFLICFPGGCFGFDIRWYPISDIQDFQRELHLLKDKLKNV